MSKIKISTEDKKMISSYVKWYFAKYESSPREYDVSKLIDNMNMDHRWLVESFIEQEAKKYSV